MRKVTRTSEPIILKNNKKVWTQELLQQLNIQRAYSIIDDDFKTRYRQKKVKEALEQMYSGLCCFCESEIGVSDYEHIEHLRPASKFPHLAFDWNNLNWCCGRCNNKKRHQWDQKNQILDPSIDNPKQHLYFSYDTINAITKRGETTIKHTGLNRPKLVKARQKIAIHVKSLIDMANKTTDSITKREIQECLELLAQDGEKYCSFIQYLINENLNRDEEAI